MIEKFYLVKEISTATPENTNHAGVVQTIVKGKNDQTLYWEGSWHKWYDRDMMTPYFIREHGYTRMCDAKRNWTYKNPENSRFWTTTVEILTVEIHNNGTSEYLVM